MRKNKGVTLVALVVVIIILIIISSVTLQVGVRVYNEVKLENFIGKLKVIQSKVDNIAEETEDVTWYGFTPLMTAQTTAPDDYQVFMSIITNPSQYNIADGVSWNSASDGVVEKYYYFNPKDLEKLGLKNQDMTVAINFETRNVITKNALKIDGEIYHRQYDVVGGDSLY